MPGDIEYIRGLTDQVSMLRWRLSMERTMKMDRLSEKLAKAAGVAQRQTVKIEARADALIAREDAIERRTDDAFAPHETILSDAERGLDAVEASLRLLSNGAPFELSTASPAATVQPEPPATQQPGSTASTEPGI